MRPVHRSLAIALLFVSLIGASFALASFRKDEFCDEIAPVARTLLEKQASFEELAASLFEECQKLGGLKASKCVEFLGGSLIEHSEDFAGFLDTCSSQSDSSVAPAFPVDVNIGILELTSIKVLNPIDGSKFAFDATGIIHFQDYKGDELKFYVTGEIGSDSSVLSFSGSQIGSWNATLAGPNVDFLSISFNAAGNMAHISGAVLWGGWPLEVDVDFLSAKQPAIGLVYTSQNPTTSFSQLPGSPAWYFDSVVGDLTNYGVVVSSYDGSFQFTSGAKVAVVKGVNLFAQSQFQGQTVDWLGQFTFVNSVHSAKVTGSVSRFDIASDLTATNTKILVQYPQQPYASVSSDLKWSQADLLISGVLTATNIHFTGTSASGSGIPIELGSTPILLTNVDVDLNYDRTTSTVVGQLSSTVTYGDLPPFTGLMKYPADDQGCFLLSVELGSGTPFGMQQFAENVKPSSSQQAVLLSKSLFNSSITNFVFAAYPNCGVYYARGTIQTPDYGTTSVEFATKEYVSVSNAFRAMANDLTYNPEINIKNTVSVTAQEALENLAVSFEDSTELLIEARSLHGLSIAKGLVQIQSTLSSMRLPLLLNFTQHDVVVDSTYTVTQLVNAYASSGAEMPSGVPSSSWEWYLKATTQGVKWPLDNPPDLFLEPNMFAYASADFHLSAFSVNINAQKGLNFMANLDIGRSTAPYLTTFKKTLSPSCPSAQINAQGFIGSATEWWVDFKLDQGCIALNTDAVLLSGSSVSLTANTPQFSFKTLLELPNLQDMTFQATGSFAETNGQIASHLLGSTTSVYKLTMGVEPVDIDSASLDMTLNIPATGSAAAATFNGKFSGAITLNKTEDIQLTAGFDTTTKDLVFDAKIRQNSPVYWFTLATWLLGPDFFEKVPINEQTVDKILSVRFTSADLAFTTNPISVHGSGSVVVSAEWDANAAISFANGQFGVAWGLQKDPNAQTYHISDFLPSVVSFDGWSLTQPVVAIANGPVTLTVPGITHPIHADKGLLIGGIVVPNENNKLQSKIKSWFQDAGVTQIYIEGLVNYSPLQIAFEASAVIDIPISKGLDLTNSNLFFNIAPDHYDVGFKATFDLTLSDVVTVNNHLKFFGQLDLTELGGSASVGVTSWTNPFGIPGLTINEADLKLTLGPGFVPDAFGITASATMNGVTGEVDIMSNPISLYGTVIAIGFQNIGFHDIATSMGTIPVVPVVASSVSLANAQMSINIGPAVTISGVAFPSGIFVAVQGLNIANVMSGSGELTVNPGKGLALKADVSPFKFGQVFNAGQTDVDLDLLLGQPFIFDLHTTVTLFDVTCAANVTIQDSKLDVNVHFYTGILDFDLAASDMTTDPLHPVDFSVSGELNVGPWLAQQLPKLAQSTKDEIGPIAADLTNTVSGLQAKINSLNAQIDARSQNDTYYKDKYESEVEAAEAEVNNAQVSVNQTLATIANDNYELSQCGSWDLTCKGKWEAELVYYKAKYDTESGVLEAAMWALQEIQKLLDSIPAPDYDPDVIEWKAERDTEEAALDVAQATLNGYNDILNTADSVIEKGASALLTHQLTFTANSYVNMAAGGSGNVGLSVSFLDHSYTFNVGMVLNQVEQFAQDVWDHLKSL